MKPFKLQNKKAKSTYLMGGMMSLLAFLVFSIFGLAGLNSYLLNSPSLAAVISAVLVDLTNDDRAGNALNGLTVNPILVEAAQSKASYMADADDFAHVSRTGKRPWDWITEKGYNYVYAGENLAVDFSDSGDVERAWMNSPTHRRNILDGKFTEIGIATARGSYKGRSTIFVVQMFGTPAAATAAGVPAPAVRSEILPIEPTEFARATTEPAAEEEVAGAATIATGALPLGVSPSAPAAVAVAEPVSASWWEHLLASPKLLLQYGYYALAVLILLVLAYVTELELKRRHLRHVVASACLFVLMIGLFTIADALFFAQPVIAALKF